MSGEAVCVLEGKVKGTILFKQVGNDQQTIFKPFYCGNFNNFSAKAEGLR